MVNFAPVLLQAFQVAGQLEGRNFITVEDLRTLLGFDPPAIVSVSQFLTGFYDAAADHTTWLQNAIQKVGADFKGACVGILLPHPLYTVSAKLLIPYDNVFLIFRGGGNQRTSAASTRASAASRLAFNANATADVLLEWAPASGSAYGVVGGGILGGVMLDAAAKATRALSVLSAHDLNFEGVHAYGATQAMIYSGCISGTLTTGDYSSKGHTWRRCKAHAHNLTANSAYALQLTGGQGAGSTDGGNSCFQRFESCEFTSRNNHAVRLEDSDSNEFHGGAMSSEVGGAVLAGGLVTGFGGLEICSSSQSGGFSAGSARYSRFYGAQINDIIIRAGRLGGGSPQGIEIFGNNFANAGGTVLVETAAGGSPAPEAIVLDRDGLHVFGDRAYNLDRMRAAYFVENVANPATETGKSKLFSGTDGALRLRRGDGSLGIAAPKAGVLAQSLVTLPNGAAAQTATMTNGPTAGNPTKWIPIDDNGVTRYIPAW